MRRDMGFNHVGERRKSVRRVLFRIPVLITVEWPEGIPFDADEALDAASSMIHQSDEVNVGGSGKIVWAKRYAECLTDEAELEDDETLQD